MEAILVESMMWAVGGWVLGILGLQTWTGRDKSRSISIPSIHSVTGSISKTPRRASNRRSQRKVRARVRHGNPSSKIARLRPATSQNVQPLSEPEKPAHPVIPSTFELCPSCRLAASSKLMEEHFLGSPFHRDGRNRGAIEDDEEFREKPVREQDPAIPGLLRSLLRLLVPPRAFGLRGQERTVDPLRGVVQRPAMFEKIPSTFGLVP